MDLVLVTPEEDEELTVAMQTEIRRERSPVIRLPLPYCIDRNPSRTGDNDTRIKPETEDFEELKLMVTELKRIHSKCHMDL